MKKEVKSTGRKNLAEYNALIDAKNFGELIAISVVNKTNRENIFSRKLKKFAKTKREKAICEKILNNPDKDIKSILEELAN